ncbi:MAG: hypothetical protein KatS3mg017_0897 [Fimbriimonadales bacterium]|nr:MAG: hypothetical protein KatS3mg017_0897 [Fimbriimonadales bacterium]
MYQPNRLLTNPVNKYIVELAKNWEGYELLLRPARRFLFHNLYRPSAYVPEFNKPCFGVLCLRDDLREASPTGDRDRVAIERGAASIVSRL